jgi:hypothetical protein
MQFAMCTGLGTNLVVHVFSCKGDNHKVISPIKLPLFYILLHTSPLRKRAFPPHASLLLCYCVNHVDTQFHFHSVMSTICYRHY